MNTLIYKRPGDPPQDLICSYTFLTDKRLFARVILTLNSIKFKDQSRSCGQCWDSRADRIIIKEPVYTNINLSHLDLGLYQSLPNPSKALCRCRLNPNEAPIRIVSKGETLELRLILDGSHAATSYFKNSSPLFEASYEFVHSPLCGESLLNPSPSGELEFPHYDALAYVTFPRSIKCIWDIKVNPERNLWLQFVKTKFASRSCEDGKLEIYLPSSRGVTPEPYMTICGENISYTKDIPYLTAAQIGPADPGESSTPGITIQFVGSMVLTKAEFKIVWTELSPSSRQGVSNSNAQKLEDCAFLCPGNSGCIPERLLCNGIVNCPKMIGTAGNSTFSDESNDESDEVCNKSHRRSEDVRASLFDLMGVSGWAGKTVGIGLASLMGFLCIICSYRSCKEDSTTGDIDIPY